MQDDNTSKLGQMDEFTAAIASCYSTWDRSYYDDYYGPKTSYPPVQVPLVRRLLAEAKVATLLDAGCGPASMLRELIGIERWGFDLTPEMVAEARRVMVEQGVSPERIWLGNVLDAAAFRVPDHGEPSQFDAALCVGVLPHLPAGTEPSLFVNLHRAVRPGGLVIVEARNALFSLFTLNRYSREFFRDVLIREDKLLAGAVDDTEAQALAAALNDLDDRFRLDLPPVRTGKAGELGYDQVLSRTHVPFALQQQAQAASLIDIQILFYHYHALPPMLAGVLPELFRRESLAQEKPTDWRGHFLASAFLLVGRVA